jgi:hypothetical protein
MAKNMKKKPWINLILLYLLFLFIKNNKIIVKKNSKIKKLSEIKDFRCQSFRFYMI